MMMIVDYGGRVHIPAMKRLRDVDLVDRGGLISPSGMSLTARRRERCAERERKSAALQRSGDFARSKAKVCGRTNRMCIPKLSCGNSSIANALYISSA